MGQRKTKFELDQIMTDNNVSRLWSWSRYKTSVNDLYGYYLKYIKGVKEDQLQNSYAMLGTVLHDGLEDILNGTRTLQEVIDDYEDKALEYSVFGIKFNRTDDDKDESIAYRYNYSNVHFLKNFDVHNLIGDETHCEAYVKAKVGSQLFAGYTDLRTKRGDEVIITDFKSSSIYTGKKINEEAGQLWLYALAESQTGTPIENIKCRWLFTKYATIVSKMKNGKTRESHVQRHELGAKLVSSASMWLKHLGYDEAEIGALTQIMVETNDIAHMPPELFQYLYVTDCYVYAPFTQETLDELVDMMREQVVKVVKLEMEYLKSKDDKLFWSEVNDGNSYFFANLSGYSRFIHKPYDEYLSNREMFKNDVEPDEDEEESIEDLMRELGLD